MKFFFAELAGTLGYKMTFFDFILCLRFCPNALFIQQHICRFFCLYRLFLHIYSIRSMLRCFGISCFLFIVDYVIHWCVYEYFMLINFYLTYIMQATIFIWMQRIFLFYFSKTSAMTNHCLSDSLKWEWECVCNIHEKDQQKEKTMTEKKLHLYMHLIELEKKNRFKLSYFHSFVWFLDQCTGTHNMGHDERYNTLRNCNFIYLCICFLVSRNTVPNRESWKAYIVSLPQ